MSEFKEIEPLLFSSPIYPYTLIPIYFFSHQLIYTFTNILAKSNANT